VRTAFCKLQAKPLHYAINAAKDLGLRLFDSFFPLLQETQVAPSVHQSLVFRMKIVSFYITLSEKNSFRTASKNVYSVHCCPYEFDFSEVHVRLSS